jgi:hypothetical protein
VCSCPTTRVKDTDDRATLLLLFNKVSEFLLAFVICWIHLHLLSSKLRHPTDPYFCNAVCLVVRRSTLHEVHSITINYHSSSHWTHWDTSNNVSLHLHSYRYSIFIRGPDNYPLTCEFANTRMPAQSILWVVHLYDAGQLPGGSTSIGAPC